MPRGPGPALQLVTEAEAKAAFDVFDTDKSGGITRDEFKAVLTFATGTGTELSAANVDELFGSLEFNQDGKRNISELAAALASGAAPMPAAVGADKYFGCEALLETVESGAIAPLSGRWLVQQWEAGGGRFPEHERDSDGHPTPKVKTPGSPSTFRLARRQDLPPEAFVPPATLRRWVGALGDDWALVFVALSYRWLSAAHPDPDGFHLAIVADVARHYMQPREELYQAKPTFSGSSRWIAPSALEVAFGKHGLGGETDRVKPAEVQGEQEDKEMVKGLWGRETETYKVGAKVTYEGREMVVSKAGREGELRLTVVNGEATDFALFWDFGSLLQKPRTAEQDALFGAGLKASNVWYGHAATACWMQSELAPGKAAEFEAAGLAPTYEGSGWCFVEAAISAAVKAGPRRLDLGRRTVKANPMGIVRSNGMDPRQRAGHLSTSFNGKGPISHGIHLKALSGYSGLTKVCTALRLPPPSPDEVARLLAEEKQFTGRGDVPIVTELYRAFFEAVTATTTRLEFRELEWGAAEAARLATVLPQFGALAELDLSKNELGAEGAKAVAEALRAHATLRFIDLRSNAIGGDGGKAIAEALRVNRVLTSIDLRSNAIGGDGGKAIAEALRVNRVLASIDLDRTQLGGDGGKAIGEALRVNTVLKSIDLGNNDLGDFETGYVPVSEVQEMEGPDLSQYPKYKGQCLVYRPIHRGDRVTYVEITVDIVISARLTYYLGEAD
jgi:hypothetical protein